MGYFLVSVSNRTNLDLCIRYALAGFTNSINGLWAFVDITEGDFISFLYGAKAFNLYQVKQKEAVKNAQTLPSWPPIRFSMSGRIYYFPFRLFLEPVREFEESLVRPEFACVSENLLLRGGYRKTHFQADQTTLQAASQMGNVTTMVPDRLNLETYRTFSPVLTVNSSEASTPEVFPLREVVLQAAIRKYLSLGSNLSRFLNQAGVSQFASQSLEVLGEKALAAGHMDLLIKEATGIGITKKIAIEVKSKSAQPKDVTQLTDYRKELGPECVGAILVGQSFSNMATKQAKEQSVSSFRYLVKELVDKNICSFDEIVKSLEFTPMENL